MWEGTEVVAVVVAEANLADVASIERDDRSELTRARLILHPAEHGPDARPWQRVTLRRPDGTASEIPWPPEPIELSSATLVHRDVLTVVLPAGADRRRLEATIRAAHAACQGGGP